MTDTSPILLWFRRDLRLADHDALTAACATGRPVIPVFIYDDVVETLGAAPKFRLGLSLHALTKDLSVYGSQIIFRKGAAQSCLQELVKETGATAVYWSRAYDPASIARDTAVKAALKSNGVDAQSFEGHVLFEPWTVENKTGGFYRVFTPMWRSVRDRPVDLVVPAPAKIRSPERWPLSDLIQDWSMDREMDRGAEIVRPYCCVGQTQAQNRLGQFLEEKVARYKDHRDFPSVGATSGLAECLAVGEISARQCWHAAWAMLDRGVAQAEAFIRQLVWRDFAYHLAYHTPHLTTSNWREEWNSFPWNEDDTRADVQAWKQGRTGIPFVDAAMREMYVTGTMHNRARMIVASYLTKNLLTHWKVGEKWFSECLIDWDPANNAMGWQWAAGSGPDAAPYFRIFNPETQLEKFDRVGTYQKRWIAEGFYAPSMTALSYFDAVPRSWGLDPHSKYPTPAIPLAESRARALEAYSASRQDP